MKLYLTSYRIPDIHVLAKLVGKPPATTRVVLIPNAKDYYAPRARAVKVRSVVDALGVYGFNGVDTLDLYDYRGKQTALADKLASYDMIWVMGGNTFCLREAMRHSGFDEIIRGVVEDKGVVFAGESAGACIAGSDLHGIEQMDDIEFAETVIWEGLNLTPHMFIPHADNPDCGAIARQIAAERADDPSVVVLNDDQAWVVSGSDERKITGVKPGEIAGA